MERLFSYAMELGVKVEFADLTHLNRNGDYCDELRIIRIQDGMMPRKTRHSFAHELGHATHRDVPSMFPHIHKKQELRADEWAATFLIPLHEFVDAEARHNGHVEAMAMDLYVLPRTVEAFKRTLLRIGDDVFVRPGLGAGNWEQKVRAVS